MADVRESLVVPPVAQRDGGEGGVHPELRAGAVLRAEEDGEDPAIRRPVH